MEIFTAELTEGNQKLSVSFALKRWKRHDTRQIVAVKRIFLLAMQFNKNAPLPENSHHF